MRVLAVTAATVAAALLYLFMLGSARLVENRTLDVVTRANDSGTLRISPDIGRGFFERDSMVRSLGPGRRVTNVEIASRTKRLQLELLTGDPAAAIEQVFVVTPTERFPLSRSGSAASNHSPNRTGGV